MKKVLLAVGVIAFLFAGSISVLTVQANTSDKVVYDDPPKAEKKEAKEHKSCADYSKSSKCCSSKSAKASCCSDKDTKTTSATTTTKETKKDSPDKK